MTKRSVFLGSLLFISLAGGLFLVSGALAKKYSFSFLKEQAFNFTSFPFSSPRQQEVEKKPFPYRLAVDKKTNTTYLVRVAKPELVLQVKKAPLALLTQQPLNNASYPMSLEELAAELETSPEKLQALENEVQRGWEAYLKNPNPQIEALKKHMEGKFYTTIQNTLGVSLVFPPPVVRQRLSTAKIRDLIGQVIERDVKSKEFQKKELELASSGSIPDNLNSSSQIRLHKVGTVTMSPNTCFRQGIALTGGFNAWAPCCDCDLCFGDDGKVFFQGNWLTPRGQGQGNGGQGGGSPDGQGGGSCTPPQCIEIPPATGGGKGSGGCPPGAQVCEIPPATSQIKTNNAQRLISFLLKIKDATASLKTWAVFAQQGQDCSQIPPPPGCVAEFHNECILGQCVPVQGGRPSTCVSSVDCGQGGFDCTHVPPPPGCVAEFHTICTSGQCVQVQGAGSNQCLSPAECGQPGDGGGQCGPCEERPTPDSQCQPIPGCKQDGGGPVCIPIGCLNLICPKPRPAIWDPLTGLCGCDP